MLVGTVLEGQMIKKVIWEEERDACLFVFAEAFHAMI